MIQSFKCRDMQALYEGKQPRRFKAFVTVAERKLAQLDAAQTLDCFRWTEAGPQDVEVVDYH